MTRVSNYTTNSVAVPWPLEVFWSICSVAACTGLSWLFRIYTHETSFLAFVPAIFFSLWLGGLRLSIFATLLSSVVIHYFLLPPLFSFEFGPAPYVLKELMFVVTMICTAWWFDYSRRRSDAWIRLQAKLIESASESILITDSQRRILYWNQGAEKLYGWSAEEAIGQMPRDLLQTEYSEPREDVEAKLKEEGHWHGRLLRKCADGRSVVIESSWALDRETGCLLTIDLDLSAQSWAENELLRANRALNALSGVNQVLIHSTNAEQLLRQAVEIMVREGGYPLAWIAFPQNDAEKSVQVGPAAGRAIEYLDGLKLSWGEGPSAQGPCGTALRENRVCVAHDFLTDPIFRPWRLLANKYQLRSMVSLPLFIDGSLHCAVNVYATEENAFEGREFSLVHELASDLAFGLNSLRMRENAEAERASRLEVEHQLQQSQKMEAIGRLAGGIAHDFNNLLMVIMAQTELLSMQLTGTSQARAESVMTSARRAADLTRQLLAFSRKQIVQPRVISLNPVLTEIARMAQHLVGEDIDMTLKLSPDLWNVKVDRPQMEQVLMNLIVNARDAMPHGGKVHLETGNCEITSAHSLSHPLMPAGRYAELTVTDTGAGMTQETQTRLFEPFFTTKEAGKGTGLGLSTVYGIVKQSNGYIWLDSELGKGTTFRIYLPAADEPPAIETHAARETQVAQTARVLLVEDESSLRSVVSEFLAAAGHSVITAESHEEAIQLALKYKGDIDILLTDIVLKGRNGHELAADLKKSGCKARVIFMSGYTPDAVLRDGKLDPDELFLQKPFSRATLSNKIHEALKG